MEIDPEDKQGGNIMDNLTGGAGGLSGMEGMTDEMQE
jgi:hypothetical protein